MHLKTIFQEYYQSNYFSLLLKHGKIKTCIKMEMFTQTVDTSKLPFVYGVLKQYLPSIFRSKCFNGRNLPFSKEVKKTEIGHLFEHMLLEYLCQIKSSLENKDVQFSGVTNWNWKKEAFGIFHIDINSGLENQYILREALKKSIFLLDFILKDKVSILKPQVFPYSEPYSYNFNEYLSDLNAENR